MVFNQAALLSADDALDITDDVAKRTTLKRRLPRQPEEGARGWCCSGTRSKKAAPK